MVKTDKTVNQAWTAKMVSPDKKVNVANQELLLLLVTLYPVKKANPVETELTVSTDATVLMACLVKMVNPVSHYYESQIIRRILGKDGLNGADGLQGPKGDRGEPGEQGERGVPGTHSGEFWDSWADLTDDFDDYPDWNDKFDRFQDGPEGSVSTGGKNGVKCLRAKG